MSCGKLPELRDPQNVKQLVPVHVLDSGLSQLPPELPSALLPAECHQALTEGAPAYSEGGHQACTPRGAPFEELVGRSGGAGARDDDLEPQ